VCPPAEEGRAEGCGATPRGHRQDSTIEPNFRLIAAADQTALRRGYAAAMAMKGGFRAALFLWLFWHRSWHPTQKDRGGQSGTRRCVRFNKHQRNKRLDDEQGHGRTAKTVLAIRWPRYDREGHYTQVEAAAQRAKAGLWGGEFLDPWEYRTCVREGLRPHECSMLHP